MSLLLLRLVLIGYCCLVGAMSDNITHTMPSGCPMGCTCTEDYKVDCSYAEMESLPHVPSKTKILIVRNNRIMNIQAEDLNRLRHLQVLDLHGNDISDITSSTMRQFLRLQMLDLTNNQLCRCSFQTRLRKQRSESFHDMHKMKCRNLTQLRGRPITVMNSLALECQLQRKRTARHGDCSTNTCKHGGTCLYHRMSSGLCSCLEGYAGNYCEWRQGSLLSLTVECVGVNYIQLRWFIDQTVMSFRIMYTEIENYDEYDFTFDQKWLNGTCHNYNLTNVKPDTMYKICVAAFGYSTDIKRSPGNLIDEVCLYQRTSPLSSTVQSTGSKIPEPNHPTSLTNSKNSTSVKIVMTIFGVILGICVVLIIAVAILYVSGRRGIRLIPRRQWRRRTPPNVVQIENPTYGSTGSPTPSVQDVPIEENITTNQNDIPLILVTSESTENIIYLDGTNVDAEATCTVSILSTDTSVETGACYKEQGLATSESKDMREDADGDSTHEQDCENGHLIKDSSDSDRSEKEIIEC